MRTSEELQSIHDAMKSYLIQLIRGGLKFEVCLAAARAIIRTNYHTVDPESFERRFPDTIIKDIVSIMVDPSTPKKVYYQIIDNIYAANKLKNIAIKDSRKRSSTPLREPLTKENRLLLLIEVNFLHTYHRMSQVSIGQHIEQHNLVGIQKFEEFEASKDIHRIITIIKAIKRTTDTLSPDNYHI